MYRSLFASVVVLALFAARAEAIEMFTNFNNGQNVGLPPMEVPISVYRGFGHGGWNPYAEGMPLKTVPPVPAMMPTGQIPHVWVHQQYSNMPVENQQQQMTGAAAGNSQRMASDRRRGRGQRGGYQPAIGDGKSAAKSSTDATPPNNADQPTPKPMEVEDEPATVKSPTSRRSSPSGELNGPTVLHAQSGTAPQLEPALESKNSTTSSADAASQPAPALKTGDLWPQADALFPRDAG